MLENNESRMLQSILLPIAVAGVSSLPARVYRLSRLSSVVCCLLFAVCWLLSVACCLPLSAPAAVCIIAAPASLPHRLASVTAVSGLASLDLLMPHAQWFPSLLPSTLCHPSKDKDVAVYHSGLTVVSLPFRTSTCGVSLVFCFIFVGPRRQYSGIALRITNICGRLRKACSNATQAPKGDA